MGAVREALDAAVESATHLTPMDMGAVAAARALADKIDAWDVIVQWAIEDAEERNARPTVPMHDNVALPAYLRYCESLGLTPAGRAKLPAKKEDAPGGKLELLQGQAAKSKRRAAG